MPIRKDKNGRWHAEVCIDGQRLHRILPEGAGKKDATDKETELRKSLETGKVKGDPLLTEVMGLYMKHADTLRSSDTAKHHAARIATYIDGKRASEAKQCAAKIVSELAGIYKPATINRSLGTLKKALTLAWEIGEIETNYGELIKRLKEHNAREVTITLAQVKRLANAASESVRAAIWIAIYTGMRRGEIIKLERKHIVRNVITIPAGNTKTLKMRTIPVVAPAQPWLKKIPLSINAEGLKTGFARARIKAKMPHVTFHDLRRSCATLMIQSGVDLYTVSKILGHSSVAVTQTRYAHLQLDQMREGLDKTFGEPKKSRKITQKITQAKRRKAQNASKPA